MEFSLLEFKIHEVNGMANIKFSIKTANGVINYDEMLKKEYSEDVNLLESIEEFIGMKVK